MVMQNTYALGYFGYGKPELLLPRMESDENTLKVSFLPEDLSGRKFEKIRFMSPLCEVKAPANGYMFYPGRLADGTVLNYFTSINYFGVDELICAQKDPDSFAHLRVRVTGFSGFFTTFDKGLQNEIIARKARNG